MSIIIAQFHLRHKKKVLARWLKFREGKPIREGLDERQKAFAARIFKSPIGPL
jgi:hypothetical protein